MPHPSIWVLVQLHETNKTRFFILTHDDLADVQMRVNKMSKWEHVNGVDNITLKEILEFENKWEKITN